jgi:hypothetical protein
MCTATFPEIVEVRTGQRIDGILSPLAYDFKDSLERYFENVTIIDGGILGSIGKEPGIFEGCMGHLKRNESDFAFPLLKFPSNMPGIKQSSVILSSKTVIVSAYNNTFIGSDPSIMGTFSSFSRGVWTMILISVLLLTTTLYHLYKHRILHVRPMKVSRKKIKVRSALIQSLRISVANLLKQHSSYTYWSRHLSGKVVLFLFALFFLLIMFYFSSMIKTEMVVQKEPETISTYDEVIAYDVRPMWLLQLDDHAEFEEAEIGSKEYGIWLSAEKKGLHESFMQQPPQLIHGMALAARRQSVWLASEYLAAPVIKNICPFMRQNHLHDDTNLLMRSDSSAKEHLMGILYTENMHPVTERKFYRLTQIELENGIVIQHLRQIEFMIAPEKGGEALRNCMANKIIYPESHVYSMDLRYYKNLFLMHGGCLLVGLVTLVFEVICCFFRKKRC